MRCDNRIKKRGVSFLLSFLLLIFPVFSLFTAHAAEVEYSAYAKPASEVDESVLYKKKAAVDSFKNVDDWVGSQFVKKVESTAYSGKTYCLLATADGVTRRTLGVSRVYEEVIDCEGYSELLVTFLALGGVSHDYQLEIRLTSGEDEYVYTVALNPNEWQDVFLDISGISTVDSISMTAKVSGAGTMLSSIAVSDIIMGDRRHGAFAEKFSAIDALGGVMTEEAITLSPADGKASVKANAMLPSAVQSAKISTVIMSVTVSGLSYAKMSAGTSSSPVWQTDDYAEKASVTVTAERETYVLCFTVEGRIVSWELSFEGISSTESFEIREIKITSGEAEEDPYSLDTSLGSITRCSFISTGDADTVQIQGKLTRDAAVDYINGEICLYMIPTWSTVSQVLSEEPLMTRMISTDFSFTVDISAYPTARSCKFSVVLRDSDRTTCITTPVSPVPLATMINSRLPSTVFTGEGCEEVFSSGAQGCVIDVPLDRLILTSATNNAKLSVWGDSYVYLDRAILSSLEGQSEFYRAAGIEFYFRLYVSSDIFVVSSGKNATGYALDVSTKKNSDLLCAAVDYLSSAFSPNGYMIGYALNSAADYYSADFGNIFTFMKKQSDVARCVYSVAASHDPQTVLLLPFDSVSEEELSADFGDTNAYHSASYCGALTDYYTGSWQSPMRWAAVISVTARSADDVTNSMSNLSGSGYLGRAFALDERNRRAEESLSCEDVRELFHGTLSVFTAYPEEESFVRNMENVFEVSVMPHTYEEYAGSIALWDFTKSFMTYSWTLSDFSNPTTQISSALTSVMPLATCRSLRLVMDGAGEDVIAAAAVPYSAFSLSDCSDIEIVMNAQREDGGEVSFTVVMGNDSSRCIFPVTVESGLPVSVMCRADSDIVPDFFAICAGADSEAVIEIAAVRAYSKNLTDGELEQRYIQAVAENEEDDGNEEDVFMVILVSAFVVVSCMIFALLSKKNR